MKGFMDYLEAKLLPLAMKLGSQRHLAAVRDGFVAAVPAMIVGSLVLLILNLPIDAFQTFMLTTFGEGWKTLGLYIYNGTMSILSLIVCVGIAYNLAKHYKLDILSAVVITISSLIIISPLSEDGGLKMNWMGGQGLFIALFVSLVTVELFRKLSGSKFTIKMPEGVPPAIAKSFSALVPGLLIFLFFGSMQLGFFIFTGSGIQDFVYALIQSPLQKLANTLPAILILTVISDILWFFGLHGGNLLSPIYQSAFLPAILENADLFQQGVSAHDVPNIITMPFVDIFVSMGGAGQGIALVAAILICAKTKPIREIAKLGAPAVMFNINEPILYGVPVVLNPLLFIPFQIVPVVSVIIAYYAMSFGWVPKTVAAVPWTMPPVIGGYLATGGSMAGAILQIVILIVSILIYIPFIRLIDKSQNGDFIEREEEVIDESIN